MGVVTRIRAQCGVLLPPIVYFSLEGFVLPPTQFVKTMAGLVTIITAAALLVVGASLAASCSPDKKAYAVVGLSFTALLVAVVSINRFVQLTIVRLTPNAESVGDLRRFLPYGEGSIMSALEIQG